MVKKLTYTLIVSSILISSAPVLAQGTSAPVNALNSTASTGSEHGSYGNSNWQPTMNQYQQQDSPGHQQLGQHGWSDFSHSQGVGVINGPDLPGTPSFAAGPGGSSGAASSMPFAGTYSAPGNFALRQVGRGSLPPTRLDSIVRNSGYNDFVFGDEGTEGPPPYFDFGKIQSGIGGGCTTGHPSGAPSAWDHPN